MGRRSVSNVPAQALILLNDPFVIEQAELWAKRVLAVPNLTPKQRIDAMYETAFAREPSAHEAAAGLEFVKDANDLAVWQNYAHARWMNVKEFIFIRCARLMTPTRTVANWAWEAGI